MNAFGELTVAECMSSPLVSIPPETVLEGIAEVMREHSISALAVIDKTDRLLGIVSQTDLRNYMVANSGQATAADLMTGEVITIEAQARMTDVVRLLETKHIKQVPVVRNGRLVGMITQTDLVRDILARSSQTLVRSPDERLRKLIMDNLKSVEPSLQDVPDFSVTDGVVRFWGAPPTAKEIEVVCRALRAVGNF